MFCSPFHRTFGSPSQLETPILSGYPATRFVLSAFSPFHFYVSRVFRMFDENYGMLVRGNLMCYLCRLAAQRGCFGE